MKKVIHILKTSVLFFLVVFQAINSYGLKSDKKQKISMDQDNIEYDTKSNKIILNGDVVLNQGTIHLEAKEKVIITKNEQGDITGFTAFGHPSTYEQVLDNNQGKIYAEGKTIHYSATQDKLELIGAAKLIQGSNTFTGDQFTYDLNDGVILGESSKTDGRVHVTFTPKKSDELN